MRNRKQPLSNGSGQFAQALRKANIPREFIVNDKIWQLLSSPQSDDEETQQSDSEKTNEKPSNRSPSRKLRRRLRPEETPRYVTKVRCLP